MGTRFKVVTDHNALKALVNKASLKGQLACWEEYLMGSDMDIVYCQELKELDTMTKYNMVIAKRLNLIFIPEEHRGILLKVSHRPEAGHLKLNKLLQFIKLRYFWNSMAKDVKEFVDKCNVCA